jgi:kynurenine formamidase
MNFVDLTMPLSHRWMPDECLPTAVKFFLGPKDHQEKGIVVGSDSGTSLVLPSLFAEFRRTTRLDQVPVEKLFLRPAVVAHINKGNGEEISKSDGAHRHGSPEPSSYGALIRKSIAGCKCLVDCDRISKPRVKMIILPLLIKQGGASPCRFIAVEE